jgi:hypothetical protein
MGLLSAWLEHERGDSMSKDEHKDAIEVSIIFHEGQRMFAVPKQPAPVQEPVAIDGNTSDGYHTFNELYEFRKAYNAALFNEWAAGGKCSVHKSWRHHDGELCFGGGWFIVVAVLPDGQISNHYEAKDWDLFAVPETERALFEFDGHTGADVVERLKTYTTPPAQPAPVQEPVAWMKEGWGPDCGPYIEFYRDDEMGWRDRKEWTPLYHTPPAQEFVCSTGLCHYRKPQEEPAQEPEIVQRVKRYAGQTMRTARNPNITARECIELANWIVATPPAAERQWVGLTDEEQSLLWEISRAALPRYATFYRLIEAKLKEKNTC